jgi:hypothetical protein
MMRAIPRILCLTVAAALLALPPQARADSPLDFTLRNRLGVTISYVYVSPHQAESWEEDVLGSNVLRDGQNLKIRFDDKQVARGDIWDLKIKTSENREYVWRNPGFNLRRISEITIILKDGTVSAVSK